MVVAVGDAVGSQLSADAFKAANATVTLEGDLPPAPPLPVLALGEKLRCALLRRDVMLGAGHETTPAVLT